jgi:ribosome recycling factor
MTTFENTPQALAAARMRMEKAVDDFRKELATIRTGRANATLLDNVRVDYHGTPMPVNQLGSMTVPDPTMIVIAPWDPSAVALIDKAIRTADLGLNPTNDGKVVRVPIPSLTEGFGQAAAQGARESPDGGAEYSAGFEGSHREAGEREEDQRRREEARAG